MRTILTTLAITILGLVAGAQPSKAEITYAGCAQYAMQGSSNCGFVTYEQCRAALSGNGGYCEQNPMFRPATEGAPLRPRRKY
jgi:hypothetical protein